MKPWIPLLSIAVVFAAGTPVRATIYVVDAQGTGDFATIQDAIDAADDGDEIVLDNGEYRGAGNHSLDFLGKAITLRSASGDPELCVIVADGPWDYGVTFDDDEGPDSVLDGIGITGMDCGGHHIPCPGTAVWVEGASPTIRNVRVTDSRAGGWASAVSFFDSESLVDGLAVVGGDRAVGITQSTLELVGCAIEGNATIASSGVGIVTYQSDVTIRSSFIRSNRQVPHGSPEGGAGIFCSSSNLLIEDTEITDNDSARYGGAILLERSNTLTIRRSTIAGNRAVEGGGIYSSIRGGVNQITLEHTILRENCATVAGTEDARLVGTLMGSIDCSSLDPSRVQGIGALTLGPTNSFEDPMLCEPRTCEAPFDDSGIYSLRNGSPLENLEGCGLVGVYGVLCTVSIQPLSWGQIKSQYR